MELQLIDWQVNEILNGTRDLLQFNQPEHAGVCSAGPLLVGALLVCDIARESISSSINAGGGKITPSNWEIDEAQEREVQAWAEAKGVWVPQADKWLEAKYGPMIAQGAEAKVYGCTGDTHVVNYISEHLHLEDMHPANVFVEERGSQPVCIDCIVKFKR